MVYKMSLEHFGRRAVLYRDPAHCSSWPAYWSESYLVRLKRPCSAMASGFASWCRTDRHRLLAGGLHRLLRAGGHTALHRYAGPDWLATGAVWNAASLPQHARLSGEIPACTNRLLGTHLVRPLSLPRACLFSDLLSRQRLAHRSQPGAASRQLEKRHRNNPRLLHHRPSSEHVV